MPDLKWYINRARAMSPEEITHRTRMEINKVNWRRRVKAGAPTPVYPIDLSRFDRAPVELTLPVESDEASRLIDEARAYLRHEWFYGGMAGIAENAINWHADPQSGIVAPLKFGFDINHRDETLVGNIKFTWEKSRHHHLTVLAVAYTLTGDERYSAEVAEQIVDWVKHNPYLMGVHWTHPLEQGIRLISWLWCERLLRGSEYYERAFGVKSPVWASIYQHQEFIEHTYSRGSSANNHLIGEMAGLFAAAAAWPIFEKSAHWRDLSLRVLEREIVKQTFPSGINRELAFSYHIFALEFFLIALVEARRAQIPISDEYTTTLRRMLEVMPQLTDAGRNLPNFGDGDEGMAIQLQAHGERRDSWLYRAGRVLLKADVPVPSEGSLAASVLGFNDVPENPTFTLPDRAMAFEDAGLYLLTQQRGMPEEVFMLADAGPHGYLSIAAHGHADALSFTLSLGGQPMLIDPGTYAYHTDVNWRKYFRGTAAHNTVMIDGQDQSTQQGAFLWSQKAKTTVERWTLTENGAELIASHDGYSRLGVMHQRRLTLDGSRIVIEDTLEGAETHEITFSLHLAPECSVEKVSANIVLIKRDQAVLRVALPSDFSISLVRGAERLGWYSPKFGVRRETHTIVAQLNHSLPYSFTTEIEVHHED